MTKIRTIIGSQIRHESWDFECQKGDCTVKVAKTKGLISCVVSGYGVTDLRLCFRICKKESFS